MVTFLEGVGNAVRSAYCTWLGGGLPGLAYWVESLNDASPFPVTRRIREGAHRILCNREPEPILTPPFEGGQCDTRYNVTVGYSYIFTSGSACVSFTEQQTFNGRLGPIQGVTAFREGFDVGYRLQSAPDPPSNPDGIARSVIVTDTASPICPARVTSVNILNIVRVDGQPDDCGAPAPDLPDIPDSRIPERIIYDDGDVNIVIPVIIGFGFANFDIDGTLNIPFTIEFSPEFNFEFGGTDGALNPDTGDVVIEPPGTGTPPGTGRPPISYDPEDPPPDEDGDVPEPDNPPAGLDEEEEILRGVLVTVTVPSSSRRISELFQEDIPNIFVPRFGNVSFMIRVGKTFGWTDVIEVRNRRQFIPCPWEGGAIEVRGSTDPGVEWILTPVYVKGERSRAIITG